jgi:hypothetical protein
VKPVGDGIVPGVAYSEDMRNRGRHQIGLADGGEVDKPNAIREGIGHAGRAMEGEVRLANAARASQGKQPDIFPL